jgi:hypothetical protein
MGCNQSSVADGTEHSSNKQVEAALKADRLAKEGIIKILLLGAGESGKSTVFKQMKLLYGTGMGAEEIARAKFTISENILLMISSLIIKADEWGVKIAENVREAKDAVVAAKSEDAQLYPALAAHIKLLWQDPGLQSVWERRAEFQIVETHKYYIQQLDRYDISGPF